MTAGIGSSIDRNELGNNPMHVSGGKRAI